MKYRSVFDIIGPIMIGPSSSHTAGAVRIGRLARKMMGGMPQKADIHFYGSFAQTYQGHATDVAVLAGLLGLNTDDPRIPETLSLARDMGLSYRFLLEAAVPEHPNTVKIDMEKDGVTLSITGISIGGGAVQITMIDDFLLRLSGDSPSLLIFHKDASGTVATVTGMLAQAQVNISHMEVSRTEKGKQALMIIETDQKVDADILQAMKARPNITKIIKMD